MSFQKRDRFFALIATLALAGIAPGAIVDYKGRNVVDSPTGSGAIDMKAITVLDADRIGSFVTAASAPTVNSDSDNTDALGSCYENTLWKNTAIDPDWLYICLDATPTQAEWVRLITESMTGIVNPIQIDGTLPMLHIGPTATISINPTVVIAEPHTGNANFRGVVVESTMTPTTGGHAYAAYDTKASLNGDQDFNHINAFQSNLRMEGSGTLARMSSVRSVNAINSGTVTELRHFDILDFTGSGTVPTQYGLYIGALNNAATNWALYSTDPNAKSYLAGFLGVGHTNATQRVDTGGGDITMNNGQWYKMKGTGGQDNGLLQIDASDRTILNAQNTQEIRLSIGATDYKITVIETGVGIFTTSPDTALQVVGTTKLGDDNTNYVSVSGTGVISFTGSAGIALSTNAGLTASTNQIQGQGALTAQVNQISTVANNDDTVTLPAASAGVVLEIINDGAETLQIFPASGDDLGLGTNTAEELQANERVAFVAYNDTNWAKESTTEIIHAEIHDEDNGDAFVINDAGGDFHSYHTNGLAAGDVADWAFDAGGAGTSHAITAIADGADSGVDIAVTTGTNHLLAIGDIISQTNLATAAYVGIFKVKDIISPTVYEVAAVFDDDVTGTMDQAATLEADAVAAGVYSFAYYVSATLVGNNETFDFQLCKETTPVVGSKVRRKFSVANDYGSMAGGGVVAVGSGEKLSFALSNEDSTANIILRNLTIVLIRL